MKITDMFKKLKTFNEMAVLMGLEEAHITFLDEESFTRESFKTYKEFKTYMKREYVDWFSEPLMKFDDFEFDEYKRFMAIDPTGIEKMNTVTFFLFND